MTDLSWKASRWILSVQHRITRLILAEKVKRQAAVIDRLKELADQLDADAAHDEAARGDVITELIERDGVYSGQHPEVLRLAALADVQRDIAQTIRRTIDGEVNGQ